MPAKIEIIFMQPQNTNSEILVHNDELAQF